MRNLRENGVRRRPCKDGAGKAELRTKFFGSKVAAAGVAFVGEEERDFVRACTQQCQVQPHPRPFVGDHG